MPNNRIKGDARTSRALCGRYAYEEKRFHPYRTTDRHFNSCNDLHAVSESNKTAVDHRSRYESALSWSHHVRRTIWVDYN